MLRPRGCNLPVLTVLLTMLYWLWRVRIRRNFRGVAGSEPIPGSYTTS